MSTPVPSAGVTSDTRTRPVPTRSAVSEPDSFTRARSVGDTVQRTCGVTALPSRSTASQLNETEAPTIALTRSGRIDRPTIGAGATRIAICAFLPSSSAMIVARPGASASSRPLPSTRATAGSVERQSGTASGTSIPVVLHVLTRSTSMSPLDSIVCSAVIDSRAIDAGRTRIGTTSSSASPAAFVVRTLSDVAPGCSARTIPAPSTTASSGASHTQVAVNCFTSRPRRSMPRTFSAATAPISMSSAWG